MNEVIVSSGGSFRKVYVEGDQNDLALRRPEIGSRMEISDGRKFRLVSTEVDMVPGQVVSAQAATIIFVDKLDAANAGDMSVVVEISGISVNQFRNGTFSTVTAGRHSTYEIDKNSASDGNDFVTLHLTRPLDTGVGVTDDCILKSNRFTNVRVGVAASDGIGVIVGASTAGTTSKTNFIWVQTAGEAAVGAAATTTFVTGNNFILAAGGLVTPATNGVMKDFGFCLSLADPADGEAILARLAFD